MDWREAESEYSGEGIARSTLPIMFERAAARHEDEVAQMYKGGIYDRSLAGGAFDAAADGEYAELTYDEMRAVVRRLAAGFRELGIDDGERVAIYAETRLEWVQCDFAIQTAGGVVTTVYPSSSEQQVQYLLADPGASVVVAQNRELLEKVLAVEDSLALEAIVVMDDPGDHGDRDDVYSLADLYRTGEETFSTDRLKEWLGSRDLDDLATIIYTSGTTGRPKGVKLTQWNVRANVNDNLKRTAPRPDRDPAVPTIDEDTRTLSFLPMAHVFERMSGHYVPLASGATVAYAESPDTLEEDFQLVQPTGMIGVPRVYEKLYRAMREQAEGSAFRRRVFNWASEVARQYHEDADPGTWLQYKHSLAETLVFSKVKEALGGDIEVLYSGGGTLSADLAKLYHGMDLPIIEGYGLTETSPTITVNPPEAPKAGTIGVTVDSVDIKIDTAVVPDEEFQTMGDTGELLVRGPNVFEGYWNMPDKTDEVFEEDEDVSAGEASGGSSDGSDGGRWFRTGDIVTVRADDYLVFHEREKQLLVTSTGKNVPPAPIEDSFADSEVVEQCMVVGDGEKFVAALVVPDVDAVRAWADSEGIDLSDDDDALCRDERVHERIQREIDEANEKFEPHEQIKKFRLVAEEWTEDNDLLTPTMKKKRHDIRERYHDELQDIYRDETAPVDGEPAAADD
jgi:long-chain acyl-CoA synthetase